MNTYSIYLKSALNIFAGLACIICVLAMISCAARTSSDTPAGSEHLITYEKPFGPTINLRQLLTKTMSQQYSSVESIFEIPSDFPDQNLILLTHEKPVLFLENRVTAFTADDEFLAAGYSDGNIRVWSDLPCPMVTLPQKEPVARLWRDSNSPFLIATGNENPADASIYDLNKCAMVAGINSDTPAEEFSVSSRGTYLALVDKGRRLWTGNLQGNLEQQAALRFDPLDMTFSPREGVLMLADQAGWLILWTTPDYSILKQQLIPEGPFDQGDFLESRLVLRGSDEVSHTVVWDIPGMKILETNPKTGRFTLENQILRYTLPDRQPVKKIKMSRPAFKVMADQDNMIFKVLDVDGKTRNYNAITGFETEEEFSSEEQHSVHVHVSGRFAWAGVEYALADPVVVSGQWALWSRYIPEQGFYLWWTANQDLKNREFSRKLPVRDNIRKEIPPGWVEVDIFPDPETLFID